MKRKKEVLNILKELMETFWPEVTVFVVMLFLSMVGVAGAGVFSLGEAALYCVCGVFLTFVVHAFILYKKDPDVQEKETARRYNNYMYTCPMCGSHHVSNITSGKKAVTIGMVGAVSSNFGKNYQCENCGYKW